MPDRPTEFPCPQCGAPIAFRSVDLPVRVCGYCRTSVLRDDAGVRAMGTAAIVPDDVSPIQLGARGRDGDAGFEIVGRVRWRWTDGGWNEWLALFADGSHAWLGEAMGRIMLLRPAAMPRSPVLRDFGPDAPIAVGTDITIDKVRYAVVDSRTATALASEGELPFPAPAGQAIASIDLHAADGRCASIQHEGGAIHAYAGRYVTLADLRMTGLRAFEGWPMPRWAA